MFLTDKKADRRIEEIKGYRYRDVMHIESFAVCEDEERKINPEVPTDFANWQTMRIKDHWAGRDHYLWMHADLEIPAGWKGRRVVGIFDFGKTGAGNNAGFESLCYLNGKPYQGVDSNHMEVFFPEEVCGTTVNLTFRLWSGLEGGGVPTVQEHQIKQADLGWLDESTDDLYYMGRMVADTVQELEDGNPAKYDLRSTLDEALACIDWAYPGSDIFYETVAEAGRLLNTKVDAMDKQSPVTISCVGHTHIDLAWLWRLKHTHEKASRSFSTVLRMMEMFPEYIFLQSQPQLYEYVKEDFPEIYEEIKKRIKEGRWEADGGMWVEADCNLTSGESLTRQLLLGSRFLKEEFDQDVEYLWLPDVFGYSWALPQILKKSGINTFMTTKISWNQYNRMPHDTFRWKGIDGSEILTHFITAPEPWNEPGSWFYTYNGKLTPQTVKGTWEEYRDKEVSKDLLIAYGYGDGGGGVNRDMLESRRRIDKIPGLPNLKPSTARAYFNKLQENVKNTGDYVHTWDGELYLEYHRGTYTSQAYNKRMNRKLELLYRKAEWLTAMGAVSGQKLEKALQETLTKGWKLILTNQFHDIIPGSSIHEVYEDSKISYAKAEEIALGVVDDYRANHLKEEENVFTVYNDSPWEMSQAVCVPVEHPGIFTDGAGAPLRTQWNEKGACVLVEQVPAMGNKRICYREGSGAQEQQVFAVEGKNFETPFYSFTLNDCGQITRLYDKEEKREVLAPGQRGNVLQVFEDKPIDNDAWDIDIFYQQKMREVNALTAFEVRENGPLKLVIYLKWNYMNTVIEQEMILHSTSRRIDFETKADMQERQQLFKASFPVDIRSTYATYDVQYGNVRRPNHWNTSWDQARFESVGHRFADLSERNYGVALLNDCKYGYDIRDNVMRISLMRSGLQPDHLQDLGEHVFTYSLLPHRGDFVEGRVVQEAFALNEPMDVFAGADTTGLESFFTLDNDQVEIDAVKKSEDGRYLVIRMHDFAGAKQRVELKPAFAYKAWAESDLMERPEGGFSNQPVCVELHPFEIVTLLFEL